MTIKSKTHKGEGFNELRFEDEKGIEEIFVHAEKDYNKIIQNHYTALIGSDYKEKIYGSFITDIGFNNIELIGGDKDIVTGGDVSITTGSSNSASGFQMSQDIFPRIKESFIKPLQQSLNNLDDAEGHGNFTVTSEGSSNFISKLSHKITTLSEFRLAAHANILTTTFSSQYAVVGENSQELILGKKIISANGKTTIQAGSAKISLNPNGDIEISGNNISINGSRINLN